MVPLTRRYSDEDEEFLRGLVFPRKTGRAVPPRNGTGHSVGFGRQMSFASSTIEEMQNLGLVP